MSTRASERPTRQDLDRILERTRERIESLLRRRQCTREVAMGLLREAVADLARQWSRIPDHEQWLLDRIEAAVCTAENPSLGKPPHDEEDEEVPD